MGTAAETKSVAIIHRVPQRFSLNSGYTVTRKQDIKMATPLMIFANGYARPYTSDRAEIASAVAKPPTWFPASVDFQQTATKSGDAVGATTLDEMLKAIEAKAAGSISLLGLVGHAAGGTGGNPRTFGLSGQITVNPANVILTSKGFVNADTLTTSKTRITALRNRFTTDAHIVFYACNTGMDSTLLDAVSIAFGVCVDGFSDEVLWCFKWTTPRMVINSRGRVYYDKNGLYASGLVDCDGFTADATNLTTDLTSCVGAKGTKTNP